jgi:two-component system KDP operon response regulator KdpE
VEALSTNVTSPAAGAARLAARPVPARLLILSSGSDLELLKDSLADEPWLLEHARCAAEASELMRTISFDAALVDANLPDHGDLYWLPSAGIPIIIISTPAGGHEFLTAFMPEAADFIFKPLCAPELVARIKKVLGRVPAKPRAYHSTNFYLDAEQRHCVAFDKPVQLTAHETNLLTTLLDAPRQFCTNQYLVEQIWGRAKAVETQNLRVLVAQLRKKIERQPHRPEILLTVFGVGYRLLLP